MSALWEIQVGLFAVLSAGLTIPVYERVPKAAALPYLNIGEENFSPDDHKTGEGETLSLVLHFWGDAGARKEITMQMKAVKALLHRKPAAVNVAGFSLWDLHLGASDLMRDVDDKLIHGVMRFHFSVELL